MPDQATRTACERQETDAFREPQDRVPRPVRMGKLFDWSAVDRCRLLILLTLPFFAAYALRSGYLLAHPDVEPYFDRGTLVPMRFGLVATCFFWAFFLVWGSLERRRPGSHTLYLVVGSLSWWFGVVGVAYALGNTISSFLATLLFVGVIAYIVTQWREAIDRL